MKVPRDVSLAQVENELEEAEAHLGSLGLRLDTSMLTAEDLRFRIAGASFADGEPYIVEFQCDDYRAIPPYVEMIDPDSGEPGTKHAYPNCFHNRPCICARFNRKTYPEHTGLHGDWKYGDWATDGTIDHLGGMISHIWGHIHGHQGSYTGRQA